MNLTGNQCHCTRCGNTFADELAWGVHKPLGRMTRVRDCKFPRQLYQAGGIWHVRPSFRPSLLADDSI